MELMKFRVPALPNSLVPMASDRDALLDQQALSQREAHLGQIADGHRVLIECHPIITTELL